MSAAAGPDSALFQTLLGRLIDQQHRGATGEDFPSMALHPARATAEEVQLPARRRGVRLGSLARDARRGSECRQAAARGQRVPPDPGPRPDAGHHQAARVAGSDDWEAYRPHTNVLWLHYLLTKLLKKLPKTKQVTDVVEPSTSRGRLVAWVDVILLFSSAEAFVAQQVIPHLERDAEAPRRVRRVQRPRLRNRVP